MKPFAVIDSETDPFKHGRIPEPFVWGYYDGTKFRYFTHDTIHSMIGWIADQDIIVYAHNGGKFDYHFLLPYMEAYDEIKIINGRIAQFRIGKAEFRDSYNILPVPLSAIEISAGESTIKKQEFDYSLMEKAERYKPEIWEKIIDYLRDDCVTLYEAINAFQIKFGRHLTQAGAAMAQWKKITLEPAPRSSEDYFNVFSPYYYGGRTQCFRHGIIETDFSVFDINSAYPYAMMEAHAYGLDFFTSPRELSGYSRGPAFFHIRAASHGAFPFRDRGGLSFPDDGEVREFFVTGWELQTAIDTATDGAHIVISVMYHHGLRDFAEYVDTFYQMRLTAKANGDKAGDLFAKIFLNSLYGKWGANPENYANYHILPHTELDSLLSPENEYSLSGELGPWLLAERPLEADEMRYYNVATAASITGYVRAYLWRAINKTGVENCLYCDTDSIATKSAGNELNIGKELGAWKHEGEFDKAGIAGKKMYIFRGKNKKGGKREYKTASKGVRLSNAQLWKVAGGSTVTYNPDSPSFSVHSAPRFVSRKIRLTK